MKVVAAVLAAGSSRRFGRPKQLALFRGMPLVGWAVEAMSAPQIDERAVILGANADAVARVLGGWVVPVRNERWSEGMASSIRTAVAWAEDRQADALVLLLCDQPLIDAHHVARLIESWRGGPAAASIYAGTLGVPAVFGECLFPDLRALQGDRGAASILRTYPNIVHVPCPEARYDVDVPHDIETLDLDRLPRAGASDARE